MGGITSILFLTETRNLGQQTSDLRVYTESGEIHPSAEGNIDEGILLFN